MRDFDRRVPGRQPRHHSGHGLDFAGEGGGERYGDDHHADNGEQEQGTELSRSPLSLFEQGRNRGVALPTRFVEQ